MQGQNYLRDLGSQDRVDGVGACRGSEADCHPDEEAQTPQYPSDKRVICRHKEVKVLPRYRIPAVPFSQADHTPLIGHHSEHDQDHYETTTFGIALLPQAPHRPQRHQDQQSLVRYVEGTPVHNRFGDHNQNCAERQKKEPLE